MPSKQDRPHIRIELVSDPIYLSGARELVGSVARRLGFDDLQCSKIALAVDEALCNIIRHGYDRAPDKPIWISVWPAERDESGRPSGIRLRIEDEARQVEPEQLRGRELDDIRPGGLGVHIIREVMDEVEYTKRDDKGMRLSMIKRVERGNGPGATRSVSVEKGEQGSP